MLSHFLSMIVLGKLYHLEEEVEVEVVVGA
jgi:hypothetical protein